MNYCGSEGDQESNKEPWCNLHLGDEKQWKQHFGELVAEMKPTIQTALAATTGGSKGQGVLGICAPLAWLDCMVHDLEVEQKVKIDQKQFEIVFATHFPDSMTAGFLVPAVQMETGKDIPDCDNGKLYLVSFEQ